MSATLACLIIDDPLLKPSYGDLNYKNLLQEMKEHRFFTEIAFIPWNYKRSESETVRLFSDNPDYYSICIHGCDHLGNEFSGNNYEKLVHLAYTAIWRMEQHKMLTGLPYDPVIVFPQGRFSSTAARALKDAGYLAAFNSNIQAVDMEEIEESEYQFPFTKKYHNFPIFLRRYPKDRLKLLDDLKYGRPIIILEHPGAFRNGYQVITDLIDWINKLGDVRWTSLAHIAEHYGCKSTAKNIYLINADMLRYIKAGIRRFVCEVRDNYAFKSFFLLNMYKRIRG